MKQQRYRFRLLGIFLVLLLLILILYGGYTMLTSGNRWFSSSHNVRLQDQKETVTAGDVMDRNRVVLATTVDGKRTYAADEATRRALVHVVGDSAGMVANGVETFQSNYLLGFDASLPEMIGDLIGGKEQKGNNILLTVDSRLCANIAASFGKYPDTAGKNGAAVVMNWKTGEVLALVSLPAFDPENITDEVKESAGTPFWNRATQGLYPPGSTFKCITAAAALKQIPDAATRKFTCVDRLPDSSPYAAVLNRIGEFRGLSSHNTSFLLNDAFRASCNKVFAEVALEMGHRGLKKAAEGFGFNDHFLFRDLVVYDSVFPRESADALENAACGYGQSGVAATPLHMCMVAAAIANGGVMMEPRLLWQVESAGGKTRQSYKQKVYRRVCDEETAGKVSEMMLDVTTKGSGTAARVAGMDIRGKTGTSEAVVEGKHVNYGWMIALSAREDQPWAVSVLVEDIAEGVGGGTTAGYIARDIFRYLKNTEK